MSDAQYIVVAFNNASVILSEIAAWKNHGNIATLIILKNGKEIMVNMSLEEVRGAIFEAGKCMRKAERREM